MSHNIRYWVSHFMSCKLSTSNIKTKELEVFHSVELINCRFTSFPLSLKQKEASSYLPGEEEEEEEEEDDDEDDECESRSWRR